MVNIPLLQVDAQTPLGPSQLARILNQIQKNIIDGINRLQMSGSNSGTVVGQEITAYLTESQFQQQMGSNWVLADGRNVAGSAFAKLYGSNTLPDRRATMSRMKDNGRGLDPAGDLPLGTYEADSLSSHSHSVTDPGHIHGPGNGTVFVTNSGISPPFANGGSGGEASATASATTGITISAFGGSETRAKAIISNVFIRIN